MCPVSPYRALQQEGAAAQAVVSLQLGDDLRESQLERQRSHLHELRKWAGTSRGACKTCRWRKGWEYTSCTNPAVAHGTPDPYTGNVAWSYPPCDNERSPTRLPTEYSRGYDFTNDRDRERLSEPTLCGPLGLLWEPRTWGQELWRWVKWAVVAAIPSGVIACTILVSPHGG